jgi:hypothetical protein
MLVLVLDQMVIYDGTLGTLHSGRWQNKRHATPGSNSETMAPPAHNEAFAEVLEEAKRKKNKK